MRKLAALIGIFSFIVLGAVALPTTVNAASQGSLYSYDFRNATSIVSNQAIANTGVSLTLVGDWTSGMDGVTFDGNTTNKQSSSYAKPASGPTIAATTSEAIGVAVTFTQATGCFTDSQNISQVGFFSSGATQVKLQLSKCASNKMYPECRIAGALTPANTGALRGTTALTTGQPYRLECVKSADAGTTAQVTMRTTDLTTNVTTINTFTIPDTGKMSSTAYLSVGGKYPLAPQSNNTDQYRGVVTNVAYCKTSTVIATQACLEAETVTPPSAKITAKF